MMKENETEPDYGPPFSKTTLNRFHIDLIHVLRDIRNALTEQNALSVLYMGYGEEGMKEMVQDMVEEMKENGTKE